MKTARFLLQARRVVSLSGKDTGGPNRVKHPVEASTMTVP
jgi:hypothetical protein